MAQESWAAGTIIGSKPDQGTRKGAYIPIADIPNAPQTVSMPSIDNYPKGPTARYDYLPGQIDMASRAKSLMQSPLPGSFEEAGNIKAAAYTEAAAKGAKAQADAVTSIGESVTKAAWYAGQIVSDIANKGRKDSDSSAPLKFNLRQEELNQELQSIQASYPPSEWQARYDDALKRFDADTSPDKLGAVFPKTIDDIEAKRGAASKTAAYNLTTSFGLRQTKDATDLGNAMIQDGIATNNFTKAHDGVEHLEKLEVISHEQAKERYDMIDTKQGMFVMDQAKLSPETAAELANEAQGVIDGKPAKTFTILNKNPQLAPNALFEAREEVKKLQNKGVQELSDKMDAGEIKDRKQFDEIASRLQLSDTSRNKLWNSKIKPEVEPIPANYTKAQELINNLDPNADTKNEKYIEAYTYITGNIDKGNQARYIEKLRKKVDDKDKATTLQTNEVSAVKKEIERRDKLGYNLPTDQRDELMSARAKRKQMEQEINALTNPTPEATKKIMDRLALTGVEKDAEDANAKATNRLYDDAETFHEKNPEFKQGELNKTLFGDDTEAAKNLQKNVSANANAAQRATAVPTSTGVPTKDELVSRLTAPPLLTGPVNPRNLSMGGRAGTPEFQAAIRSPGPMASNVTITAYTPGKGDPSMEGKNAVASRGGPAYTMEDYIEGRAPYVSVAMDSNSKWQGQYIVSPAFPNVIFKVEDTGSAFQGKGETAIDIAYRDQNKGKAFGGAGTSWKVVPPDVARGVGGGPQQGITYGGEGILKGVNPQLMSRVNIVMQQFPQIAVRSGFRDIVHNERVGGAQNSAHTRGQAVDLNVSKYSIADRLAMIEQASRLGILGIGVYENSLHFDIDATLGRRAWGPSHGRESVPGWAKVAIARHTSRSYGNA